MKDPRDYLANYTPASGGWSLGRLKDDPGDETGSGITVLTHNDFLYAFMATILSHRSGGLSETDESETASDFRDALEELVGWKIPGVSAWSAATTYGTLGTAVLRHGRQFVNILNSYNTNKDPVLNPTYWYPVPRTDEILDRFHTCRVIPAELSPLHTLGGTYYQQTFSLGRHRFGGASGVVFNAYGIHLDGTTVVGGSTLATAVAAHWAKDIFAPEAVGVRTLKDLRECVIRSMGASGGNAATLAEVQAAMMQDHGHAASSVSSVGHNLGISHTSSSDGIDKFFMDGTESTLVRTSSPTISVTTSATVTNPNSGSHGAETRGKSFVAGVPYIVAMVAV